MISNYLSPSDFIKSAYSKSDLSITNSYLSQQNIEINVCDHLGQTALGIAVGNRNVEFVRAVFETKKIVNFYTQSTTILHIAMKNNYLIGDMDSREILELILENLSHSKDFINIINRKDINEDTPLNLVVKYGYIVMLKDFLKYRLVDLSIQDLYGNTPLNLSLKLKNVGIALEIIEVIRFNKTLNLVNIANKNQEYPLLMAASIGNIVLLKKILLCEPNLLICNLNGQNVLHIIFAKSDERLTLIILDHVLKNLNDFHNLLSMKDYNGNTPLMIAMLYGSLRVVKLLLNFNTDIHSQNKDGNNILHLAALSKCESLVLQTCFYIDSSVLNITNKDGQTPLYLMAHYGYFESIRMLLSENKIDISAVYECGNTFLHHILNSKEESETIALDLIKIIIKNKDLIPILHHVNFKGETPLIIAGQKGYKNVFQVLIKCVVNVNKKDDADMTAYDWLKISVSNKSNELESKVTRKNNADRKINFI